MKSWVSALSRVFKPQPMASRRRNFVVLFPGRTGSSHLVSCLAQHPQILVDGEKLVGLDIDQQRAYLEQHFRGRIRGTTRAVGFKTKLKDVASLEEFRALLRACDVRVITLVRENRVKLAVSTLNARRIHAQHGRWNLVRGESRLPPLDASVDEILSTISRVDAAQREVLAFAATLSLPQLDLTYETLLGDHTGTIARVETFLHVDTLQLSGTVEKATDDDLRQSVVAYDELSERLHGTPYASDLESTG